MKSIIIAIMMMVGGMLVFPASAEATGLFARARANRVLNVHVGAVRAVNVHAAPIPVVVREQFVYPQRVTKIVEVPDLEVRRELVVVKDHYGRIVDVRQQKIVEVQRQKVRNQKIIIERNVIRGH